MCLSCNAFERSYAAGLFASRRANRVVAAVRVALELWVVIGTTQISWQVWLR